MEKNKIRKYLKAAIREIKLVFIGIHIPMQLNTQNQKNTKTYNIAASTIKDGDQLKLVSFISNLLYLPNT